MHLFRNIIYHVRTYDKDKPIYKIACGACDFDYNWTEILMKNVARHMDGLSLHFYTKRLHNMYVATGFSEEEYIEVIDQAYKIEELVTRHAEIMNRYDPEKRVGLIVDEWGT